MPTSGTGYAGDGSDVKKRAEGQKQAKSKQAQDIKSQCEQFRDTLKQSDVEPTEDLLSLLRQVLRNFGIPSENQQLRKLTLQVIESKIFKHHPKCIGNKYSNDDTVFLAMQEAAKKCQMMVDHTGDGAYSKQELSLARRLLGLFPKARTISDQTSKMPEIMVTDSKDNYREALRLHAFGFCEDLPHHHHRRSSACSGGAGHKNIMTVKSFLKPPPNAKTNTMNRTQRKRLFQELSNYQSNLPIEYGSSILVRAMEGSMDYVRALIFGPEDTPYANGCFIFDIWLNNYPQIAPKVQFMTTGGGYYRFNPNLYACGNVCLSLLGTWDGPGWKANESTLYQLLISIQSLILGESDPYFNEPGYESSRGTAHGRAKSEAYNQRIREYTCNAAILPFLDGSHGFPEFQDAIDLHFSLKQGRLFRQLQTWVAEKPNAPEPRRSATKQFYHQPAMEEAPLNGIQQCLTGFQQRMAIKEHYSDVQIVTEESTATASRPSKRQRRQDATGNEADGTSLTCPLTTQVGSTNEQSTMSPLVISVDIDDGDSSSGMKKSIGASVTVGGKTGRSTSAATEAKALGADAHDTEDERKVPALASDSKQWQMLEILDDEDDDNDVENDGNNVAIMNNDEDVLQHANAVSRIGAPTISREFDEVGFKTRRNYEEDNAPVTATVPRAKASRQQDEIIVLDSSDEES